MDKWVVYWLHDERCINLQVHGYVGISGHFMQRLGQHQRNKRFPANFEWSIIFSGTKAQCVEVEHTLRPLPGIGWNRARGGKPMVEHTDEVRARMSKPKRMREQIEADRLARVEARRSGEWNRKLREANTGFIRSEASKAKQSASMKGVPKSAAHCAAISRAKIGSRLSDETKLKISLTQKRRHQPQT